MTSSKIYNKRKLRILYVTSNQGFCNYYRLKWPSEQLVEQGYADVMFTDPNLTSEVLELATWADIIVFQYALVPDLIVRMCNFVKENKIPQVIAVEFDDNYFNVHPLNAACYMRFGTKEVYLSNPKNQKEQWYFKNGEHFAGLYFEENDPEGVFDIKKNEQRIKGLEEVLSAVDVITTTTKQLAESYSKYNDIAILPNCINPKVMPIREHINKDDKRIIIGWQGGDSHFADLRSVFPALERIKKKYGKKVHFVFWGAAFLNLIDKVKGEFIPWTRPNLFYENFSRRRIDIGIIPVIRDKFNYGKSAIKWMENSYYGIPSVVANEHPYKSHIKHDKTAMAYNDNEQAYRWLEMLIEDPILRKLIGNNARARVMEHYTIKENAHMWATAYLAALDKKIASYENLH